MTWDETNPAGTRAINLGDNDIRQMKTDLRTFLSEEHVAITDFSSALTGYHKFPRGSTALRPSTDANAARIYFNTTTNQIEVENLTSGSGWYAGGAPLFATGTKMVFYQSTPPTGWTASAVNDMALRGVTSGTTGGSTGGTTGFSSAWAAKSSDATDSGAHTHAFSVTTGDTGQAVENASGGDSFNSTTGTLVQHNHNSGSLGGTTDSATGGSHSHNITAYSPLYADVVIAAKD